MDPYIGEIKLVPYLFAPVNWHFCDGSLLPISNYSALYALLGTTYGGDGVNTFGLPDLRGNVAISFGQSTAGSNYVMGETGGVPEASVSTAQLPAHSHNVNVSSTVGTASNPANAYLAVAQPGVGNVYTANLKSPGQTTPLNMSGSGAPHYNMQPYLALNYIIALEGIYPSPS